jgi:hypothetical protein
MDKYFSQKFRKIINDLKRRPEDAAADLGVDQETIENILNGKKYPNFELIKKAINVWPVNYSDFFSIEDDTKNGFRIFKKEDSDKTARKVSRDGKSYYLYKDTVMSKLSPFRPEWIEELITVNDSDPQNNEIKFNNGHFLHQFTYFIGPVNFYYIKNGEKKVAEMNTGDSMYISPYVPHSFTTRKNKEKINGLILALTYTDKIDNEVLNELRAIGQNLSKKYKINLDSSDPKKSLVENINYYLKISSIEKNYLEKNLNFTISKAVNEFFLNSVEKLLLITKKLDINLRDILPPSNFDCIKIQYHKESKYWYLPNNNERYFKIKKLTDTPQLPTSKSIELTVLTDVETDFIFSIPCHQYIYNLGVTTCNIKTNKDLIKFKPGDSIYIKPNLDHTFYNKGKLLILRIGGQISGENLYHLSMLDKNNFDRLLNDNIPWFNK